MNKLFSLSILISVFVFITQMAYSQELQKTEPLEGNVLIEINASKTVIKYPDSYKPQSAQPTAEVDKTDNLIKPMEENEEERQLTEDLRRLTRFKPLNMPKTISDDKKVFIETAILPKIPLYMNPEKLKGTDPNFTINLKALSVGYSEYQGRSLTAYSNPEKTQVICYSVCFTKHMSLPYYISKIYGNRGSFQGFSVHKNGSTFNYDHTGKYAGFCHDNYCYDQNKKYTGKWQNDQFYEPDGSVSMVVYDRSQY